MVRPFGPGSGCRGNLPAFLQRDGRASSGHGANRESRAGGQRLSSGRRAVRRQNESRQIDRNLLAEAAGIPGRHAGLDVSDQFVRRAAPPCGDEIGARELRRFVAAQILRVAAGTSGLIDRCVRPRLAAWFARRRRPYKLGQKWSSSSLR